MLSLKSFSNLSAIVAVAIPVGLGICPIVLTVATPTAVVAETPQQQAERHNVRGGELFQADDVRGAIAKGTLNDFVTKNPTNGGDSQQIHAYFNYLGANPDQIDHFRLLGNNTFGFEDMYGGGDRDFNDGVPFKGGWGDSLGSR
jgi:hypothetical protein